MAHPTLEQLLNTYRDHDLPKDPDPEYKNAGIEQVPVCGPEATLLQRMYGYPDNPNNVLFLPSETAVSGFLDVDSSLYRRFLSATGGMLYQGEPKEGGHYVASLDLCRSQNPSSGKGVEARYSVFATNRIVRVLTDQDILSNHPDVPALRGIDFSFYPAEIVAIVRGANLDRIQYRVQESDPSRLMVFPDLSLVDRIIAFVKSPHSPIAFERRWAIAGALEKMIAHERDASEMGDRTESSIRWSTLIGVLIGAPPGLIMAYGLARQFGWTKPLDRLIDGAMNFIWEKVGLSSKVDFTKEITPEMVEKGEIRRAIGRDEDYLRLREMLNQERARIATVTARAGEGKTHFLDGIAREIYDGRMPEFPKEKTSVFKLSLSALIGSEDAKYVGQLQTRWNDFVRQVERESKKGRKVVVLIDEIHRISGMGATEGGGANDLGNTIKDKISEWERNPNIRMIGATTVAEYEQLVQNPQTKQRDEALERRFPSYRLQTLSYETMRMILDDSASEWSQKSGVEIPEDARKRALDLGFHERVQLANPDAALDILDRAQARARTRGEKSVSADMINVIFAEKYGVDASQVSAWTYEAGKFEVPPPAAADGRTETDEFLDSIGFDQTEREGIPEGELAKAVILRLAATGEHPEIRQEIALLNRFVERNPDLIPDRDELVRLLLTNRSAGPDGTAKSTAEVVRDYAERKNLEEESRRVLDEAARKIDQDLERSRRAEEERRRREREGP